MGFLSLVLLGFNATFLSSGDHHREIPQKLKGHFDQINVLSFSPDGKILVSGGDDRYIRFWDLASGNELRRLKTPKGSVSHLAFSPDGRILAFAEVLPGILRNDGVYVVHILDPAIPRILRSLVGHKELILSLAFAPDGKLLASGGSDGQLILWNALLGGKSHVMSFKDQAINSISFSQHGRLLAATNDLLRMLDFKTGKEAVLTKGAAKYVVTSCSGADWVVATSRDGFVQVIAPDTQENLKSFSVPDMEIGFLSVSSDGRLLALLTKNDRISVWELASGQKLCQVASSQEVRGLALSPDGQKVASAGGADFSISIWNIATMLQEGRCPRSADELDRSWKRICGNDPSKAWKGIWQLVAGGNRTLAFVKMKVKPVLAPNEHEIAELIDLLANDKYSLRAQARIRLGKIRELAEPALRAAFVRSSSLEVRSACKGLLDRLKWDAPERLTAKRIITVIEYLGTEEACDFLASLSKGASDSWLAREAAMSLLRLARAKTTTQK